MVEVTAAPLTLPWWKGCDGGLSPHLIERVCVEAEDAETLETEPQRCPR
jgi:hypothetical protein